MHLKCETCSEMFMKLPGVEGKDFLEVHPVGNNWGFEENLILVRLKSSWNSQLSSKTFWNLLKPQ